MIVAVLSHEPVAGEIVQMLVAGIHGEHVVHRRNATEEVSFLDFYNPGNHQLFAGSGLGSKIFGLGASSADFLRIAAVERDPGPSDSEIGIFFHRGAPIVVAAFEIEILVIFHALDVELAGFGGRSCDRQRGGLARLRATREQRHGEQSENRDCTEPYKKSAAHQDLRNSSCGEGLTSGG